MSPIYAIKKKKHDFIISQKLHTIVLIFSMLVVKNMVQNGLTGNLIHGPTGIGPRNTPHLVQLNITWTGPRSNGPMNTLTSITQGRNDPFVFLVMYFTYETGFRHVTH